MKKSALAHAKRLQRSQLPVKWQDVTAKDYQIKDGWGDPSALAAVVHWSESIVERMEDGRGLLLHGSPGPGKSLLACIAANAVLEAGGQSYFLPVDELVPGLYARIGMRSQDEEGQEEARRFDRLLNFVIYSVDLLVLDDLGAERMSPTQYTENQLNRLLRMRGNRSKPVILTSNLTIEQMSKRYGAPFASYLHEICQLVHVQAPDYRARFNEVTSAWK